MPDQMSFHPALTGSNGVLRQKNMRTRTKLGNKLMKKLSTLLAATAIVTLMAGSAWSKTLVYCSEASPEGFDPGLYTGGQTFDASSRTVYNRLVEFKHGWTEIEPGLAESWKSPPTVLNTLSSCARASSSRPPNSSRRHANSMLTT